MNELIAIVDDEPDIIKLVSVNLKKSGFLFKSFSNGKDFLDFLKDQTPDLIILDLMLPDLDGIEICKKIRGTEKIKNIPVIMLTAKGEEIDVVLGLEIGADDYVIKPFSPKELIARIKAILRRRKSSIKNNNSNEIIIGNILKIDFDKYKVYVKNKRIDLTTTEFKILHTLAYKKEHVFSREQILDIIWGDEKYVVDRTIDVHIKNLRDKLGEASKFIKNIRGVGYKIEE